MNILVIDDHTLIRDALKGVLKVLDPDVTIIEAEDGASGLKRADEQEDLDLVLLDLHLPDRDGFSMLAELRAKHPASAVVVLSGSGDVAGMQRALQEGAQGYIPKTVTNEVMLSALRLVFAGGIYVPPELVWGAQSVPKDSGTSSPADLGLTARQMQVLKLMLEGKSNKVICRELQLAEPTVKNHMTSILRALNVTNRTQAVVEVSRLGWKV